MKGHKVFRKTVPFDFEPLSKFDYLKACLYALAIFLSFFLFMDVNE